MAELNATPPNLPLAPAEYERRYQDQLNNILRLFFNQISNPGNIGGATLNLNVGTLPTSADFDTLRPGDVYYDISGGTATSYPLRIKA
jgi:hypothetical protein